MRRTYSMSFLSKLLSSHTVYSSLPRSSPSIQQYSISFIFAPLPTYSMFFPLDSSPHIHHVLPFRLPSSHTVGTSFPHSSLHMKYLIPFRLLSSYAVSSTLPHSSLPIQYFLSFTLFSYNILLSFSLLTSFPHSPPRSRSLWAFGTHSRVI